jgi:hypothetical protein
MKDDEMWNANNLKDVSFSLWSVLRDDDIRRGDVVSSSG